MEFLKEPLLPTSEPGFSEGSSLKEQPASHQVAEADLAWTREPSTNVLFSRTLAMASTQEKATSKIMRGPFLVLAVFVGLWPERRITSRCMVILGVIINVYIIIGAIFVWKVCAALPRDTWEKLTGVLCYGSSNYNLTKEVWGNSYTAVQWVHFLFSAAQFCGYTLMVVCILKALPSRRDAITLKQAYHLVTRKQWINLNVQILISFTMFVIVLSRHVHRINLYYSHVPIMISNEIQNAVFWFYVGTPCWIFAVMTNGLESLVDACFNEIKEVRGSIDDVTKIYTKLCKRVFSTSLAFKYWFVVNWFAFGITFAADAAVGMMVVSKSNPSVSVVFISAWIFIIIHTFLYPSICAASLTSKCADLLERLNLLEADQWDGSGHPLQNRRRMNEFLMFANQIQCGFRVGRINFNNRLAWLSFFFGLAGLMIKVL